MTERDDGPAHGGAAAVASLTAGLTAGVVGALGTGAAFLVVSGAWPEGVQLAAFSAPSALAAVLGGCGIATGAWAAWTGAGRWPGRLGLLGAGLGCLAVAGALAWLAFLGGLALLASFAWH